MNHEKLECYQQLLKLAEEIARKVAKWPRGHGDLKDQLKRALTSSILLLAEGNAKRVSHAERHRFFDMSIGSIGEVAACLDLARVYGLMNREEVESYKSRLKLVSVQIDALP